MSISRALSHLAALEPSRMAVTDDERALTRAELDAESNPLARAYAACGVAADDLVCVMLPNTAEFVVACAAIWKLGATPQPLSHRLPFDEQRAIVTLGGPALVVGAPPGLFPGRPCLPAGYEPPGGLDAEPLPDAAARSWKAPTSSGSTGRPKIVLAAAPSTVDPDTPVAAFLPRSAVQLVSGPLYHSAPFTYAMRGLMTGHSLVVLPRFDEARVLSAIEEHRITWMLLVPTMMHRIWRLPPERRRRADVSSVETVVHLGAPCAPWLKRAWIDWLGPQRLVEVYAGTESQGLTMITGQEWLEHPGSVGRPCGGSRMRVVDTAGDDVPGGTVGRILMTRDSGPSYRYLGAPSTAVDGWDSLGDLGWMDAEGYLYLADREDDLIICGGVNVYPAEVEGVLEAHPLVRSAAVTGVPDDDLGQRVHAVVDVGEADLAPSDVLAWASARLDPEKRPRSIEIVHTPLRDDAGKLRRHRLTPSPFTPRA